MADLDGDRFVAQACDATGLDDFGADAWHEGFAVLMDALESEARLNELGGAIVEGEMLAYLSNRLQLIAHRNAHPEVAAVPIVPPIVIVGQGRTGTTILYDLLAEDPATRVPLTWEVDRPFPPPETATYATDPRIDEVEAMQAAVEMVIPGFRAMHPLGARLAEECVRITALDFRSMIFPTQYRVPSYGRWLLHEADMTSAYDIHRMFLQHLQSRHPAQRWVLKSPGHIWSLDPLVAAYPDALMVQTHRDPLRIIASVSSLVATLRSLACDDPTIVEAAPEYADYIIDGLDRSVTAREDGTVRRDRVVDVNFDDFMADPFATIGAVYDRLGFDLSVEAEGRMRRFLDEHPQDKFGKHRYSFADTGLDEAELRQRVARYQDYFGVPSERLS